MGVTPGTIDFHFDAVNDIVIMRPRWHLETSRDVLRWYELQASYFSARFEHPKDVIVLHDAFDVAPRLAMLWGQYRAKLHETFIRYSVRVHSNSRVRLTTNTSAARYSISALETATLEDAITAIQAARPVPTSRPSPPSERTKTARFPALEDARAGEKRI